MLEFTRREAIVGAACVAATAHAKTLTPVREHMFPSTFNLLAWAGTDTDVYKREGLDFSAQLTTNSPELIASLMSGAYQIATSSLDNVVAYNSGQAGIDLPTRKPLIAVMGLTARARLPLFGKAGLRRLADLRGARVGVDAPSTGYAFVIRDILRRAGLGTGTYELVRVGTARERHAALRAGTVDAALLTAPFDQLAREAGLPLLADGSDFLPHYQTACVVTTRAWAAANPETLVRTIRAKLNAYRWATASENRERVVALLQEHNSALDARQAAASIDTLRREFQPLIEAPAVRTVLALRAKYGIPRRPLPPVRDLVDLSYYHRARAG